MTAAIKNSVARLSVGKSITLADHAGAEVKKTGKGIYSVNGHVSGDLEHTLECVAAHEQDSADQEARLAEHMNDSQVAAAEQQLDDEAAAGGRDNNEPLDPADYGSQPSPVEGLTNAEMDQHLDTVLDEQPADPTPDAEPGDNADAIAAAAPAAEWPTDALSDEPLTETAVSTAPGLKTLTPAAILLAAPGLPSRPLPALIRLGAGGDPKARYYPGVIVSFDAAADGMVSVRLTGKDRAENRPFQLLREKQADGTVEITAQHKVSRRTICIGTPAFDSLIAQKPKRSAADPGRATRISNDIKDLEKQLAASLIVLDKAKAHHQSILNAIALNQQTAAPAEAPTEALRAEAEAKGVTFSHAPATDGMPAIEPAPAILGDAGEFGSDDEAAPAPPEPAQPAQTEEFAGNDAPAPAEYEIIESAHEQEEIQRERIEEDLIEDEQYQSIDRELIAA